MVCMYICTPRQGQYTKDTIKLVVLNVLSCKELGGPTYLNIGSESLVTPTEQNSNYQQKDNKEYQSNGKTETKPKD